MTSSKDLRAKRVFATGATRDTDEGKLDYEGFFSPTALEAYARYMHHNRLMADGSKRDSDNWQRGIPRDAYMKSMFRHFMDVWRFHRGHVPKEEFLIALCGLLFNANGYLHELLKETDLDEIDAQLGRAAVKREVRWAAQKAPETGIFYRGKRATKKQIKSYVKKGR